MSFFLLYQNIDKIIAGYAYYQIISAGLRKFEVGIECYQSLKWLKHKTIGKPDDTKNETVELIILKDEDDYYEIVS